jgi:hypothetical protein
LRDSLDAELRRGNGVRGMGERSPTTPILPGQLSIGSQVTVLYALK